MTWPVPDGSPRECRDCGAALSSWFCTSCGTDSFESVTKLYVAELASPWRGRRRAAAHRPAVVTAEPRLPVAA